MKAPARPPAPAPMPARSKTERDFMRERTLGAEDLAVAVAVAVEVEANGRVEKLREWEE